MEFLRHLLLAQFAISLQQQTADGVPKTISNITHNLHKTLLQNYNSDIRPCADCSTPLFISLELYLTALNKIDEIEGELNTVGYLKIVWVDERLTWDPLLNGLGTVLLPSTKVWTPIVLLGNPSKEITNLNAKDAIARVLHNGTVIWHPGDVFRSRCACDVYNYPFDNQSCSIVFTPWSYLASEISFYAAADHVKTIFYQENGGWKLGSTFTSSYTKNGNSFVRFHFNFIRRSEFFVVNIIVPITFLSFLNCLAFAIPIECGERVSYTITVLLSFAVFMTLVSDNIPKTSAPMSLLCYYLTSLFSASVLIMTCVMLNMRIFYTDSSIKVPEKYSRLLKMVKCCGRKKQFGQRNTTVNFATGETYQGERLFSVTWQDIADVFDKIGLIVSLICFASITLGMILYTSVSAPDN